MELAPIANTAETNLLDHDEKPRNAEMEGIDDGLIPTPRQPPDNGFGPRSSPRPSIPPEEVYPVPAPQPRGRRPLDVNLYATKKTVAQGMMDLALLTANANQLRYVLESGNIGPYYYFSVSLISLSIVLQLIIGIILIFLGRYNMTRMDHIVMAERLNNWVVLGVFLITAVNVFISAFGIHPIEPMDPGLLVETTLQKLKAKSVVEATTSSLGL